MYLIDMSRAHGAAAKMVEAKMNEDLMILNDYAEIIANDLARSAAEKAEAGLFSSAAERYDAAAAAARIVAARHGDSVAIGRAFAARASQYEADAAYYRERARLETWPVA